MRSRTLEPRSRWTLALVGVALLAAIAAAPATAAQRSCPRAGGAVHPADRGAGPADTTVQRTAGWERAANRLVRFADHRPLCDPARREALRLASTYYAFAGAYDRASEVALRAAEQGRLTGHLTEAADAFIAAATFALEAGDRKGAAEAAGQAALLAESPLLNPTQRIAIRGRADSLLEAAG